MLKKLRFRVAGKGVHAFLKVEPYFQRQKQNFLFQILPNT
jgi:hypothetical protein